mmetsp:Transcript_39877/g.93354  ORF Transcript_39877/g.93354 Transcript_39877/m.93354 type:complete len:562 (-) Transcript_39877:138-1823(-)
MSESRPDKPAFFEHLSHISAEYESLQLENRRLRCALHEASSDDVVVTPRALLLHQEAHHGAIDEVDQIRAFEDDDVKPAVPRRLARQDSKSIDHDRRDSKLGQARKSRAVFGGDDIKDLIRSELAEPGYDVKNLYKTTGWAQYVARHVWFENVTMTVIVIYAIYMSVDADWNPATIITQTHPVFIICEQVFCLYFFAELLIRFLAFQKKMTAFKDGWFLFDFVLVFMMVAETWVLNLVILAMASMGGGADSNFLGDAAILRMARLMRLTRLARMARIIRKVPELLIMVKAVASALRSVGLALLLLGISVYVFAIAFRMTLDGTPVGASMFSNCAIAMHTLIMHGTFLDAVSDVMQELLTDSIPGFVLMYCFITLSAVTIMNMLIAILCEVITAVADAEKEALQVSITTEVLQTCLSAGADQNNDGCIDLQEFHSMLQNQQVRKVLHEVDVDVQTLVNFADVLFEDDEGTTQPQLPFADFMQRLLQLRGRNTATVKDLVDLRKWISRELQQTSKKNGQTGAMFTPVTPCQVITSSVSRVGTSDSARRPSSDGWALVPGQVVP